MMNLISKIKDNIIKLFSKTKRIEENFENKLLKQYGECNKNNKLNIKILFITDTHNCLSYEKETVEQIKNITEYDYCILLGDHSADDLYEVTKIMK